MAGFRILFATDFHGSELCFRKFLNLVPRVRADLCVIGGDLCGKALVPIVRAGSGYRAEFLDETVPLDSEAEVLAFEKRVRFRGFYPYRCDLDEFTDLVADSSKRDAVLRVEMLRTVERWIELAEEKLGPNGVPSVSIPGNDDDQVIDAALNASSRIVNCDARVVDLDRVQIVGFGASNVTPWHSPREFPEQEIERLLLKSCAGSLREVPLIANIHVPPYRSTLDYAPALDGELRVRRRGGQQMFSPVGSRGVRAFLEAIQPIVSLHGHVHESRGFARIGACLALNPGSDYANGVLQAVLISIDLGKRRVQSHQFIAAP